MGIPCHVALHRYFQILVNAFEAKMELYRRQIEELESHLLAISPEAGMSSQSESHRVGRWIPSNLEM